MRSERLYRHLVHAVLVCLQDIFEGEYYADKVLERQFKTHPKWGARDRHFVAESVYEITRWWRRLWAIYGQEPKFDELSLFTIFAIWWVEQKREIPPWPDWPFHEDQLTRRLQDSKLKIRAVDQAIPDWIDALAEGELGSSKWTSVLKALNKRADVILRVNTLKNTVEECKKALVEEKIEASAIKEYPLALKLEKRANVFRTNAFKDGRFEVQDAASQTVAELLSPQKGERVIDACAGAGGKTLHMAALMKNKGKIIALDPEAHKLAELRKRSSRAGVDIIEIQAIDSTKVIKRLKESADALLLDVPCSGLGVLRRNPDSKWKLRRERLDELRGIQAEILATYSSMVKSGGRMVYSTCSILPSENEHQVQGFLKGNPQWKFVKEHKLYPDETGFDGFYAALLVRVPS